jgi:hypothetical protein
MIQCHRRRHYSPQLMVLPSPGSTDRKNPTVHREKGGGAEKVTLNVGKGENGVSGGGGEH